VKILFFSPYFYPYTSGITTYPQKILSYLSKKNKIEVLTFKYEKKLKTEEIVGHYKLIRMNHWFKISKGFISPQSLIYFFKYAKSTDLIILNQPNFEGLFLAIFGKIFRKKTISIFHCQVFLSNNFQNKVISFFLNLSIKIQLNLSNNIIAYTEDYFNSIPFLRQFKNKTSFILPPIENNLPDKKLLKILLNKKGGNIWIGYAGRVSSEKGLEYLIDAINIVRRDKALPCLYLIFAGPYGKDVAGENAYYNKIVLMLKKYKLNYLFLGSFTQQQLSAFYKTIDVLVLPSINQTEAFGMVQVEAMLAGTPVIASNLPGVRIPIKLTKMGILVEPKNVGQIFEAIKIIMKNKDKYTNEKLIEKAKYIFDIKKVYKFYDKLINL